MASDDIFRDKTVLVTGVCGTVGSALVARLLKQPVGRVVGLDHNETAIFEMRRAQDDPRVALYLGDIRDRGVLLERMRGVDIVIHAAAYKHVALCEDSPADATATNVTGTQNVIETARAAGVERVLFTSSDKAVNPTNVMGASKLLAERWLTAAAEATAASGGGPVLASTRFGNVLNSRGSVVPIFARQIAAGGPITVTDRRMSRFVMTTGEAADLVLDTVTAARGGEVFITKMHTVRIVDLAEALRAELAPLYGHEPESVAISEIGAQPGEKLYEELTNDEEVRRTVERESVFLVLPALLAPDDPRFGDLAAQRGTAPGAPYRSDTQTPMPVDRLRAYLRETGIVDAYRPAGAAEKA